MIPRAVQKKIDAQVLDSAEWFGSHFGIKYDAAGNCEKCFLGGIAFVVSAMNGTTQPEEFQKMLDVIHAQTAPTKKKRVVKKPVAKKKVVRRVKK